MNATEIKMAAQEFLARRKWMARKQVEVLVDNSGDIESSISATLAQLGICAIVGNLAARATSHASRSIVCDSLLTITIHETPTINRARADHADVAALAEYIAGCLNLSPLATRTDPSDTVLPVFRDYTIAWETPAAAKATVTFTIPSTITPPED